MNNNDENIPADQSTLNEQDETIRVPDTRDAPELKERNIVEDGIQTHLLGLVLIPSGYVITLELGDETTIGRSAGRPANTHIDLTPYGANTSGVSRIHARLSKGKRGITIEDLGSTNGTFLNEYRLASFTKVPLRDGDTLEFATIKVKVKFLEQKI